jgi:hypothetical protein
VQKTQEREAKGDERKEGKVEEEQVRLIVEQVARLKDNLGGRFTHLENEINHQGELIAGRMENLEAGLERLQQALADHEQRLRLVTDGVTQFKVFSGLASGGSGIMALAAFIRSFLGAP